MTRNGLKGLVILAATALLMSCAPSPEVSAQAAGRGSYCIIDVEVGTGPDNWKNLYRAGNQGVAVCPFIGSRATLLAAISEADCSSIKLRGVRILRSQTVTEKQFEQAVRCIASVSESRPDNTPGRVQVLRLKNQEDLQFPPFIMDLVTRSGLPASLVSFESSGCQSWFCFEMLEGAAQIDLMSELTKLGAKWPSGTSRLDGDWTNCSAASAAYGGASRGQYYED